MQVRTERRVFSLTWPASMQIYWNKRKRLHKKRVQLPQDWFGTPVILKLCRLCNYTNESDNINVTVERRKP